LIPGFSFSWAALILSGLVLLWAMTFGSPIGRLNDLAVVLLLLLCLVFFGQTLAAEAQVAEMSQYISLALAMELSITMPISWLPLIGDYSHKAGDRRTAVALPFAGYFLGSVFMYSVGLLIALNSGGNVFEFIAKSSLAWPACAVVVLSTLTTAFMDLYSAAVSSTALIQVKNERGPILAIGLLAAVLTVFFPVERYSDVLINFLTTIGLVFVPVYAVVFMNFIVAKGERSGNLCIALAGMAGYYAFGRFEVGIPTLSTLLLVSALYLIKHGLFAKSPGVNRV
jgi:putative hydroxymethylpyrimidine transporter CytX